VKDRALAVTSSGLPDSGEHRRRHNQDLAFPRPGSSSRSANPLALAIFYTASTVFGFWLFWWWACWSPGLLFCRSLRLFVGSGPLFGLLVAAWCDVLSAAAVLPATRVYDE
jgi:hypothetical protein